MDFLTDEGVDGACRVGDNDIALFGFDAFFVALLALLFLILLVFSSIVFFSSLSTISGEEGLAVNFGTSWICEFASTLFGRSTFFALSDTIKLFRNGMKKRERRIKKLLSIFL